MKVKLSAALLLLAAACGVGTDDAQYNERLGSVASAGGGQGGGAQDPCNLPTTTMPEPLRSETIPVVGAVTGSFDVGPSGEARYTIPLEVPRGPGGLQPSLAVAYHEGGVDSYLGMGFQLAGLSEITRCAKTIATNAVPVPVTYTASDDFCLDGRRLYRLPDDGGCPKFKTVPDTFAKIIGCTVDSYYGPDSFEVFTRDGRHINYGSEPSSRVLSRKFKVYDPTINVPAAWLMSTVTRPGDSAAIQYFYTNPKNSDGSTSESIPQSIKYGDSAINFRMASKWNGDLRTLYADGATSFATKEIVSIQTVSAGTEVRKYTLGYGAGVRTGRTILTSIAECTSAGCYPATTFDWNTGGPVGPSRWGQIDTTVPASDVKSSSFMTMDLNGDGLDDVVRTDTTDNGAHTRFKTTLNRGVGTPFTTSDVGITIDRPFVSGDSTPDSWLLAHAAAFDYDMDGAQDLLFLDGDGSDGQWLYPTWRVLHAGRLPGPSANFLMIDTGVPTFKNVSDVDKWSVHLADLDGDGAADLVQCSRSSTDHVNRWKVNYWVPGTAGFSTTAQVIQPATFNGAAYGYPCERTLHSVDVDHDGRVDLVGVGITFDGSGNPTQTNEYWAFGRDAAGWRYVNLHLPRNVFADEDLVFIDINGDRLPDAVERSTSPDNLDVFFNTGVLNGGAFQPAVPALTFPPPNLFFALNLASVIDANGDGRQDLLIPIKLGIPGLLVWRILTATGDPAHPFDLTGAGNLPVQVEVVLGQETLEYPFSPRVTDVDGDGDSDILLFWQGHLTVFKNLNVEEDTLKAVRTGLNAWHPGDPKYVPDVSITYGHLIDTAVTDYISEQDASAENRLYLSQSSATNGCTFPRACVVGNRRVVAAYAENNGQDLARFFTLQYRDARADRWGNGWLGFGTEVTHDVNTGETRAISFDNSTSIAGGSFYPFAGLVSEDRRWIPARSTEADKARVTLSVVTTRHDVVSTGSAGREHYAAPTQVVSGVYEGDFTPGSQTLWQWAHSADTNGAAATLTRTTTDAPIAQWDKFGNLSSITTHTDGVDALDEKTRGYTNDTATWFVGQLKWEKTCSTVSGVRQCRTEDRTYTPQNQVLTRTIGSTDGAQTTVASSFAYDAFGNVTSSTSIDTFGNVRATCTAYETHGSFPRAVRDAGGHVSHLSFDRGLGVKLASKDPNGLVTRWAYDPFGTKTREFRADNTATNYGVALVSDPTRGHLVQRSSSAAGGAEVTVLHDEVGREITRWTAGVTPFCTGTCTPERTVRFTEYDQFTPTMARVSVPAVESTPPASILWQSTSRDSLGRPILDQSAWSTGITRIAYVGNSVTITRPGNQIVSAVNDARGRPTTLTEAAAGTSKYTYGNFGALTSVTGPDNTTSVSHRDAFGRVTSQTEPDRGATTATYDGFGDLTLSTDALGRPIRLHYDAAGRVDTRIDGDGTTAFQWDTAANGIGKLARIDVAAVAPGTSSTRTVTYDPTGRLSTDTLTIGADSYKFQFGYDIYSRIHTISYPPAPGIAATFAINRDYDSHGHLNRITEVPSGSLYWKLDKADARQRILDETFGDSTNTHRTYFDDKDRLHTITTFVGTTIPAIQHLGYEWDDRLNLKSRSDALQSKTEFFQYDGADRLHCADFASGSCSLTVDYETNGNIKAKSDVGAYAYNPAHPHAVATVGAAAFGYDVVGNQITRPDTSITYTARDLPQTVHYKLDTYTYAYDGIGEKIRRTGPADTTTYVNGLYERVVYASGAPTLNRYSIRDRERVIAVVDRTVASTTATYVHVDHLGSPDVLTKPGAPEKRSYDAFGQRRSPVWGSPFGSAAPDFPVGYSAHEDEVLGLVDMKGRTYDPRIGRFLQVDPAPTLARSQSWNRYSYVENNPLSRHDPSGFSSEPGTSDPPPATTGTGADGGGGVVQSEGTFGDDPALASITSSDTKAIGPQPLPASGNAPSTLATTPSSRNDLKERLHRLEHVAQMEGRTTPVVLQVAPGENGMTPLGVSLFGAGAIGAVVLQGELIVLTELEVGSVFDSIEMGSILDTIEMGPAVPELLEIEVGEAGMEALEMAEAESETLLAPEQSLDLLKLALAVAAVGTPQLGGAYKDIRRTATQKGLGGEVHHLPSWSAMKNSGQPDWTYRKAPTIWMHECDHARTPSYGASKDAIAYRLEQQLLVQDGRFLDALKMDVDAIREAHGTKYDGAIQDMGEYVWRTGGK